MAINRFYFYDWRGSADTTDQLNEINRDILQNRSQPSVAFLYESYGIFLNYYRFLNPSTYFFEVQKRDDWNPFVPERIFGVVDYAIIPDIVWQRNELQKMNGYYVLKNYPVSKTVLVKRKL